MSCPNAVPFSANENASCTARKKGDERKMPCGTVDNTSSHSPRQGATESGGGAEATSASMEERALRIELS